MDNANETRSSLPTLLSALFRKVELLLAQPSSVIPVRYVQFVNHKVQTYSYNNGNPQWTMSAEPKVRAIPEWREFVTSNVLPWREFIDCRDAVLNARAGLDAERFLVDVLTKVMSSQNGIISDGVIADSVVAVHDDVNDAPVRWKAVVQIRGLVLNEESVRISNDILIRLPSATDFEFEDLGIVHRSMSPVLGNGYPTAVVEVNHSSVGVNEVQRRCSQIMDALRLYRVGSILEIKTNWSSSSFTRNWFCGTLYGPRHFSAPEQYTISNADVGPLSEFFQRVLDRIPLQFDGPAPVDALGVALSRYRDALLQTLPIESRIALSISCLEALYLKANERSELTHRLSQRAASVLGAYGYLPPKAYRELTRAYDIRSTFIHGSPMNEDQQKGADELCRAVLDYARVSLLMFLQSGGSDEKERLIALIENALLDAKARTKLMSRLNGYPVPTATRINSAEHQSALTSSSA